MWPFKRRGDAPRKESLSRAEFAAVIVAFLSLMVSVGVARWSWLLLDEQIALREEFEQLRNDQKQTEIQYGVWLDRLKEEGAAMREALDRRQGQ